jgi:alanyl-tRNA synthetase
MDYRSGSQIREDFLRFFEGKGHRRVHSSSLVPHNDPTLLFTNAGMNQFKDVFRGAERRDYVRATSSQKCVRAGGKHNDLENVGFTRRHHTFFEMLGNFSFGDYFKRDAIAYAWELLTSKEWFGIDQDRLYVTIFEGDAQVPRDDEAERLWIETGVPKERIFARSAKDNFWQMGETGPCGPSSEIFYDLGLTASESGEDKPFPEDDQRYVEIWNLVFMQFDRSVTPDGAVLTPLPKPSIDTGMGLERIACVLQGVLSNYQTDLFTPLIARAAELTNFTALTTAEAAFSDGKGAASLRIIADHARAATFLIADGVQPANEGRGYVLRKILRRGIRHARLIGQGDPFMYHMVLAVRDEMQVAYPELIESTPRIANVVLAEEEQFSRVIAAGLYRLEDEISNSQDEATRRLISSSFPAMADDLLRAASNNLAFLMRTFWGRREGRTGNALEHYFELEYRPEVIKRIQAYNQSSTQQAATEFANRLFMSWPPLFAGKRGFYLYETFGLPIDFMVDVVRDFGIEFDLEGFEAAKEEEQQRARASWKGGSQKSANPVYSDLPKTEFEGYSALRVDGARVLALVKDGVGVPSLQPEEEGEVILDATAFYADSGGQQGDIGLLYAADHHTPLAEVRGVTKPVQGVFAHKVLALEAIAVGDEVDTAVNHENRAARPDRWSTRTAYASTSPTSPASPSRRCRRSKTSSTGRCSATPTWRRWSMYPSTSLSRNWARWRCSARSTASACGWCGSATSRPSCAGGRIRGRRARLDSSSWLGSRPCRPACGGSKRSPGPARCRSFAATTT